MGNLDPNIIRAVRQMGMLYGEHEILSAQEKVDSDRIIEIYGEIKVLLSQIELLGFDLPANRAYADAIRMN